MPQLVRQDRPNNTPEHGTIEEYAVKPGSRTISSQLGLPAEVFESLVCLFFSHIQPWLPIFHKPTFYRDYMVRDERGINTTFHELSLEEQLIFHSMFALAARFSDLPYFTGVAPADRGKPFAAQAIKRYDLCRHALEEPNMHQLQGSILLAFLFYTSGPSSKAWLLTGVVVRLAYELGIEKIDLDGRTAIPVEEWVRREEFRRAWWLVWELDTFGSIICGRPYVIPREEVPVFLPVSDEYWFSGTLTSSATLKTSPEDAWRSLEGSENQSPRAWFLVANYIVSFALGPRPMSQLDKLSIDLSINCFRLALPKSFHPPFERLVGADTATERNWVICTHLMLSANRVLQASSPRPASALVDPSYHLSSIRAFNSELSYIVDSWPTTAIGVCQPLIACTLIASHHLLLDLPKSLQDSSVNLGHALVEGLLRKFAAIWELGGILLGQYIHFSRPYVPKEPRFTDGTIEVIRVSQSSHKPTQVEEKLLRRFSRFIPIPSPPGVISNASQLDSDRNRQPQVPSGPAYSPDLVMSPFNHVLTSNILDPNSSNMVNAFTNSPIFQGNPFNSEILGFEEDDIAFNLS